jgi:hypothetical protein
MSYWSSNKYDLIVLIIAFAFLGFVLYVLSGPSAWKSSSIKTETLGGTFVVGERETFDDAAQ